MRDFFFTRDCNEYYSVKVKFTISHDKLNISKEYI